MPINKKPAFTARVSEMGLRTLSATTDTEVTNIQEEVKREVLAVGTRQGAALEEARKVQLFTDIIGMGAHAGDFLGMELPPREWLIEGLLYQGQLAMLFAKAGVGKTWLALSLAVVASTGGKLFGGYTVPNPVGVLYVDGEMPAAELQERLGRLWLKPEGKRLLVLSSELLSMNSWATPILADEAWRGAFLDFLKGNPHIRFMVLDNLSSLTPGLDEQTRQDWDAINQWLLSIRRLGVAVLLVHHAGKGGDQRGTSAREDQLDLVLKLTKVENRATTVLRVEFKKARSLHTDQRKSFVIELVKNAAGDVVLVHKALTDDRLAEVAFLASRKATQKEIAESFGISQSAVSKMLTKAKEQGLLAGDGALTDWGKACCAGMGD